ncbi:putative transporter, major facilitator subfamily protein [Monocercomonoides exilis]|uniref:putative transporter, major facilitator subfamily protein n=1 Tax=Monocercomonoides exilis TaxID=2049356 RepID=UPI0035596D18|nr:putative transporter, major facilitator subfamily protein [Monocercomonoides exilis]|eukprot:MONOS_954.1-p1 / transcript=MONOS_954.1 / gene=MONOS_954 / organism=Monocercomonoides_exilis_PA203 / gene_product=transporter, major facilitator subfamily protein / transcript_product=transporter, major facilitator subfamily protein / location=Mono_scaffold00016:3980-5950(+) / protein_length=656 / sequence_SO=supercontig / SO=protein_coding / is_pseudo=false
MKNSTVKIEVYRIRWYILFLFSLNACLQSVEMVIYSTVPESIFSYYSAANFSAGHLNLFLAIGSASFIVFVFVMMWVEALTNNFRLMCIISGVTLVASCLFRMLPTWFSSLLPYSFCFIVVGAILNNIGAVFSYSLPSRLSETWFPPNERTLATGIGTQLSPLGCALSFLIGPLIVRKGSDFPIFLYICLILQSICTLLMFIYLPAEPLNPPSHSELRRREQATLSKVNQKITVGAKLKNSLKPLVAMMKCFKNPTFIFLCISAGIQSGTAQAWSCNIPLLCIRMGFSESQGAILTSLHLIMTVVGAVGASIIAGRWILKKDKILMLIMFVAGDVLSIIIMLMLPFGKETTNDNGAVQISSVISGMGVVGLGACLCVFGVIVGAPLPLLFEVGAEVTYPLPASASGGVASLFIMGAYTIVPFLFAACGEGWMTFIAVVMFVVSTVCLLPTRIVYLRSEVENENQRSDSHSSATCEQPELSQAEPGKVRICLINEANAAQITESIDINMSEEQNSPIIEQPIPTECNLNLDEQESNEESSNDVDGDSIGFVQCSPEIVRLAQSQSLPALPTFSFAAYTSLSFSDLPSSSACCSATQTDSNFLFTKTLSSTSDDAMKNLLVNASPSVPAERRHSFNDFLSMSVDFQPTVLIGEDISNG